MTSALNPKYSFDTFVVGAANRLAVTAGHTVAESPGAAYNPLFIYSGSGLGKTHLLMAVGHAAKKAAPKLNIEYLTLDEYVEAFHASVAAGQGDAFRRRFQNVDVLLVDDVQFLTNRKEMQSELLRLTEALQAAGRQIVLTRDRPPPDRAAAAKSGGGDEFGEFLADVAVTVGKAVEAWRARVGEAVLRWEGEGYRTHRLEALLQRDAPGAVDQAITAFGEDVERLKALEAEVAELDPQAAGQSVFRDPERLSEAEEAAAKVREGGAPPPGPSAAFPLAAFAVGASNQVAVSAARAALERPGKKYNPLVLVGKSGLGKTHLLNAIGLELARGKRAVVACLSTQAFIDELISAIDGNRVDWWQARYRRATALLLDDIHLLAGKERTQEELFNLFNLLQDKDSQLVFTAPAHPNTLSGLEERIVSRLEGGLVAELKEPDRDVKRAVLERLLAQQSANPEPALIDYLGPAP